MGVPEGMRRHPGFPNTNTLAVPGKEFDKRVIAQWLAAAFPLTAHEKNKGRVSISRALMHHIRTHCLKGFSVMKINDAFDTRFGSPSLGMIRAITNEKASTTVLNVF